MSVINERARLTTGPEVSLSTAFLVFNKIMTYTLDWRYREAIPTLLQLAEGTDPSKLTDRHINYLNDEGWFPVIKGTLDPEVSEIVKATVWRIDGENGKVEIRVVKPVESVGVKANA